MPDSPYDVMSDLRQNCGSLMLATLDEHSQPHCSYTPFYFVENSYLIFISELALHTRNLISTPLLDIMLIEDESKARQLFARSRLTLTCTAERITAGSSQHSSLLDLFQQHHGNTVDLLRQLPDFHLFRLTPTAGRLVIGFGQAYELQGEHLDQFELSKRA